MAFPTAVRRATAVSSTSNSSSYTPSWTFSLNTAISAGESVVWIIVVSIDGGVAADLIDGASAGWTKRGSEQNSNGAVTGGLFIQETTSAFAAGASPTPPSFSFGGASEQGSAILLGFKVGSGKSIGYLTEAVASGSSTNSNPASITNSSGASQDVQLIVSRSGDSTVVATVAPSNYNNLQSRAGGGSNGASTNTAERQLTMANSASEDPSTFTSASEQWVSYTFGFYEFTPSAGGTARSYGFIF